LGLNNVFCGLNKLKALTEENSLHHLFEVITFKAPSLTQKHLLTHVPYYYNQAEDDE